MRAMQRSLLAVAVLLLAVQFNVSSLKHIKTIKTDAVVLARAMSKQTVGSPFPCGDDLDKKIFSIAVPAVVNFMLLPLVGAVDTFWVGQMKEPLAIAGQAAANQVFSSIFWIISFLPSVTTPLIARAAGQGDQEKVQDRIGESLFIGGVMGLVGMAILLLLPEHAISMVLAKDMPARKYALPYLKIRAIAFCPSLLATIAFSAFRGLQDVVTPLKIAVLANLVNMVMDPLLIFRAGLGVSGAAAATVLAEVVSFSLHMSTLAKKGLINWSKLFKPPSAQAVKPLMLSGLSLALRSVALNIAFLSVTRKVQALDATGIVAAAHAISIQLWQLGGVFLLAMSTVASILVPAEVAKSQKEGRSLESAKLIADRMLIWGVLLGVSLGGMQLLSLPLLKTFSPLAEVQRAARLPSIVGAALQCINGVVFIGEGIQQGNQYFLQLAGTTFVATAGMLASLHYFGHTLAGVWASFAVFNLVRMAGVLWHHFQAGPLAARNMKKV